MPFFMVQHNVTDSEFYAKNVAEMIKGAMGMGPMGPGEQEALGLSKETEVTDSCLHPAALGGDQTLYQHSINFPAGPGAKIGWCVFETKPGSDWTAAKLKEKQDLEKKPWATQDVTEIMKPAGTVAHFA